jgi:hypothetical protein
MTAPGAAAGQPQLTVVLLAYQQAAPGLARAQRQRLEALHTTLRRNILALATDWVQVRQRLYRQVWRPAVPTGAGAGSYCVNSDQTFSRL